MAVSIRRYLEALAVRGYSETTLVNMTDTLGLFAAWCRERGVTRPVEVTRPVLERYQRHLFHFRRPGGKPLSFRTQRNRLTPLKGFFGWLVKQRYLLYNPASELELPKVEIRLPIDVLSAAEVEELLRAPDLSLPLGLRDRAILETFYSTGMRRAELLGLELYDVRVERGWVAIRQGKGKRDRIVPIGDRALAWVVKYLEQLRPSLVFHPDERTVFLTTRGERFTPHRMTQLVRGYLRSSGVRDRGACHLLRHSMATLMLENGADIRFIQQMLGHAVLSTTQIYTRVSIGQLKKIHQATHPARLERRSTVAAELRDEGVDERS